MTLQLTGGAVATSGRYFSIVDGRSAFVIARDGRRLAVDASMTIVSPRSIWADGLTKVAIGMPHGPRREHLFARLRASAVDDGVHLL